MKKRSATLIAAGLVLAMGIGALAVSLGLTGPAVSEAAGPANAAPIVRVERRTVTVHRQVPAPAAPTTSTSAPGSDDSGHGEDEQEHEDHDEFGFEIEDD
jgi:hypothetical protein